jgi:hypothetical protein
LIDTPGTWFLKALLRSHSYDPTTLLLLDQVTKSTSAVGDWVKIKTGEPLFGRVVAEGACPSPTRLNSRDSGTTIPVEFIDKAFGDFCGVRVTHSDVTDGLMTRRVRTSKIVHCSPHQLLDSLGAASAEVATNADGGSRSVSDRIFAEIAAVSRLDRAAVDCITRESGKSPDALASLFSSGLPEAVLSSIDVAERQMASLEPKEDLPEKISSIGNLSFAMASQLFATEPSLADDSRRLESTAPTCVLASAGDETGTPSFLSQNDSEASMSGRLSVRDARDRPSPPRRIRMREMLTRRDTLRRGVGQSQSSGPGLAAPSIASLQQQRIRLLSLMSGSRRGQSSSIDELMEREVSAFGGDLPPIPPILGVSHQSPTRSSSNPLNAAVGSSVDPISASNSSPNDQMTTFLDSILRCRIREEIRGFKTFPSSIPFIRQLVSNGLLVNSFAWVKAIVDSYAKKGHVPSSQKSSSILSGLVDEEGNSLLRLAILLGCTTEILNFLIVRGAVVETKDLQKAAETDQARSLALLLKHSPIHLHSCPEYSQSVQDVLADAKARQEQLELRMRGEVGGFMVQLLRRLLSFGLRARRRSLPRVELCSKAIAEILVGNSLLQSLLSPQRSGKLDHEIDSSACDNEDDSTGQVVANDGLLSVLPMSIVQQAYLTENHFPRFLALVEDFMCSKDMNDGAIGLSLLSIMLRRLPEVRHSEEMTRFGIADLIGFHDDLASGRLSDIQGRQTRFGSSKGPAVCCPSNHLATLFITRHSSFRCDICGNGIDRGRPMHGCRRCDWDACEMCTDKAQSGIVKCKAIKDLVAATRRMLSDPSLSSSFLDIAETSLATTQEFQELTSRLLNRDTRALRDIGVMLLTPGKVSIHQILTDFLPSFHSAYISSANEDHLHRKPVSPSGRRCKKARVIDGLSDLSLESPEDRLRFCVQSIRLLVAEDDRVVETRPSSVVANDGIEDSPGREEPGSADRHVHEVTFSDAFQELVRRLHQVLAMRERVESFDSAPEYVLPVVSPDQKGSDLQNLTKPIELCLYSSASSALVIGDEAIPTLTVQVEPLVPINDVSLYILRSSTSLDESYIQHCKQYVSSVWCAFVSFELSLSDAAFAFLKARQGPRSNC